MYFGNLEAAPTGLAPGMAPGAKAPFSDSPRSEASMALGVL